MKTKRLWMCLGTAVLLASPGFACTLALAADDAAAKLKELERAMTAPKEAAPKPKFTARAIVFDNQPQESAPAADAAKAPPPAQASAPRDCASLPADTKVHAVDFSIQFKIGSAELSHSSEGVVTEIAKILSLAPDRCVLVEGHTDSTGNADKNLALSRDRAASVVKYISDKSGIERKRLVPIGKGSTDPLKNLDPRDAKNRRVVFKVVVG